MALCLKVLNLHEGADSLALPLGEPLEDLERLARLDRRRLARGSLCPLLSGLRTIRGSTRMQRMSEGSLLVMVCLLCRYVRRIVCILDPLQRLGRDNLVRALLDAPRLRC